MSIKDLLGLDISEVIKILSRKGYYQYEGGSRFIIFKYKSIIKKSIIVVISNYSFDVIAIYKQYV